MEGAPSAVVPGREAHENGPGSLYAPGRRGAPPGVLGRLAVISIVPDPGNDLTSVGPAVPALLLRLDRPLSGGGA